jgi:hypothetical protein
MVNEINQFDKDKCYMFSLMCGMGREWKHETERETIGV